MRFSAAQETGHIEVLPIREGHRMDDAEVDPDGRVLPRSDGDCRLLDSEADVPAERIFQQSGTADAALRGSTGERQAACPPESHASDEEDRDLAPAAIHTDDSEVGRLRDVDRHTSGPMLEPRTSGQPSVVPIPGAEVVPKDLLAGLRWQLRQPLPPGQGMGAGVA
jgi:hypothetical protein